MTRSSTKRKGPEGCHLSEPVPATSQARKAPLNANGNNMSSTSAPVSIKSAGAEVERAAIWLADLSEPPRMAVPELRNRFGINAVQACEAIALARKFQINRRAFG